MTTSGVEQISNLEAFSLDLSPLLADPSTSHLANGLAHFSSVSSNEEFNDFCQSACNIWSSLSQEPIASKVFEEQLNREEGEQEVERIIETGWGRVVVTKYHHPEVEKFLVVKAGHFLALEKHSEKVEHLEVIEGVGLLLFRKGNGALSVQLVEVGSEHDFAPGEEHCLIALENLLVFETSTDPKGMDQDLVFIYTPETSK